ncbi:MAG: hypothetical protein ACLQVL_25795 [Terriglobia bacterium]
MTNVNRRQFIQVSAATMLLGGARLRASAANPPRVSQSGKQVRAEAESYNWEWTAENDRFRFIDKKGRVMAEGSLQPAVVVQAVGQHGVRRCTSGKVATWEVMDNRLTVVYEGVNESAKASLAWTFDGDGAWLAPVSYESSGAEDVVSLHYFAQATGESAKPAFEHNFLVHPGISESSEISPIIHSEMGLHLTSWLGHGSPSPGLVQQWALPVHYFCGFHRNTNSINLKGALKEHLSDAFCCGLAELPAGDMFLEADSGRQSIIIRYESDVWGHLRGPGRLSLGARLYWAMGANYYEAIRHYYLGLVKAGVISKKTNSAHKNDVVATPQFNSWGAEVALGKEVAGFDEPTFNTMFDGLKASGMKPGMFVFDQKWLGKYGELDPSPEGFPHFDRCLERVRAEGYRLGFWTAFLRCEDPRDLGLTPAHMLHKPDGTPYLAKEGSTQYYLIDFTQAEVAQVLGDMSRRFMRRYKPDLIKFDFGYELPLLSEAAPKDMSLAGERLLLKGVEVLVKALREVNPDMVVIYYSLSPLFIDVFDQHSPDDLFLCEGDYDLEANRRFFFSSLLGELGMPTYGSGGYDWPTMPSIWFDSAPIGTLGSLNSFSGDEQDTGATPERVAKYNGLANLLRTSNVFSIEPLDAGDYASPTRGARTSSWVRRENGEVVLLALRKDRLQGGSGTGKYQNIIETNASVVVASKTAEGISRASRLGVVPYGDGQVTIRRDDDRSTVARVTEHSFGGRIEHREITMRGGKLRLPLTERDDSGAPIEWIEIQIT